MHIHTYSKLGFVLLHITNQKRALRALLILIIDHKKESSAWYEAFQLKPRK